MPSLTEILKQRIARDGALTIAEFMEEALGNPEFGYYHTRDPLGAAGDFTTAPEISQMFGELVGLWCVDQWHALGQPSPVQVVELGPGRGTLMSDALRAWAGSPEFLDAARITLVETSPILRERQRAKLAEFDISWATSVGSLSQEPILIVANEFFDALPVRQFEMTAEGWRERLVDQCPGDADFEFTTARQPVGNVVIPAHLQNTSPGTIFELAEAAAEVTRSIAHHLDRFGGAALIFDYGHTVSAHGDTLQAVKDHDYAEVLQSPGEHDLTAHVDFQALSEAAMGAGARIHGPVEQGAFLQALGLGLRAQALLQQADDRQARDILSAVERLTGRVAMGRLFKVLALTGPDAETPAGFGP